MFLAAMRAAMLSLTLCVLADVDSEQNPDSKIDPSKKSNGPSGVLVVGVLVVGTVVIGIALCTIYHRFRLNRCAS